MRPERSEALAETYGAHSYASLDALLASEPDLDLVSVCTPNGLHHVHTLAALEAGAHVLCEKPMALSVFDCGSMIQAAEQANRRLFVVKQNRFNPPVVEVRRLIQEGRLGQLYSMQLNCFWNRDAAYYDGDWKGTKALDGGILFTQFSHFIDLAIWLLGDVRVLSAASQNFAHTTTTEFEDTLVSTVEFRSGVLGTLHFTTNAYAHNMEGSLTLFGERGTVKIGGEYINTLDYHRIHDYQPGVLPQGGEANDYGTYKGSMSNHDLVYDNVADVLLRGGSITTSAFDGLKTVDVIERIYAAVR